MPNHQINISLDNSDQADVHQVADEIWARYADGFNADRGDFNMRVVEIKAGGLFGFNTGWRAARNILAFRKPA